MAWALRACLLLSACAAAAGQWLEVGPEGRLLLAPKPPALPDLERPFVGSLYVEPATLHALGFEWEIGGDENRNARVQVRYRPSGVQAWKQGHDLLRIKGERVGFGVWNNEYAFVCGNLFAGSILFLDPGTRYDVWLTMTDPDQEGVVAERWLRVTAKGLPLLPNDGRARHVRSDDDLKVALGDAQPGDYLMLHAGTYRGNHGIRRSGTRAQPIVLCDAGDGPVVFQGDGRCFEVDDANYVWFQGLTFRGYEFAVHCGGAGHTKGLTVVRCRFEDNYAGILTRSTACRDIYIADNTFIGAKGTWHRAEGKKHPYKAVWLAGQGIDVAYNRVQNHWDGLSTWKAKPTRRFDRKLSAVDFYHNDVGQIVDDNEADYGQHNIRFWRNRIVDMHVGLSAQPIYGGPCYFVRNLLYNVTRGVVFKLNCQPAGVLIYHNTCVSHGTLHGTGVAGLSRGWWNTRVHNNLFLGLHGPSLLAGPFDPGVSRLDHNGYCRTAGPAVEWFVFDEQQRHKAHKQFASFEAFTRETGFEAHHVEVGFDDLVDVKPTRGEEVTSPLDFGDPRLRTGSRAIDAGMVIPNITDGFRGAAPDLGAIELGDPLPHYGPRHDAAR